jgi:hypothetical protein
MNLIVAFSGTEQYPTHQLKTLEVQNTEILICSPYDCIYSYFGIKLFLRRILRNSHNLLTFLKGGYARSESKSDKEISEGWATSKKLNWYFNDELNYKAHVISPRKLDLLIGFWPALSWTLDNYKFILETLKGQRREIYIQGIESTGYILDSLMRWSRFKVENEVSLRNLIFILFFLFRIKLYFQWFDGFVVDKKIGKVIVNHNVYMESGWVATYMHQTYETKVFLISKIQDRPIKLLDPRDIWIRQIQEDENLYLFQDDSRGLDPKAAGTVAWYSKKSIANLSKREDIRIDCKSYLVVMHAFHDANNIHIRHGVNPIFPTYYHWIKKTLEIAIKNPSFKYKFRIHPAVFDFYPDDLRVIEKLFSCNAPNIFLEDSRISNSFENSSILPLVVTYQGSISLECALMGCRTITLSESVSPEGTYIKAKDLQDYVRLLTDEQNPNDFIMGNEQIEQARLWKNRLLSTIKSKD